MRRLRRRKTCIRHCLTRRTHRALDKIVRKLIELGTRELQVKMLRTRGVRRDERQIDRRLHHARKLNLRLFRRFQQALCAHLVGGEVDEFLDLIIVDYEKVLNDNRNMAQPAAL